ncbi:MAG: Dabb family protein [Rhodobacteraceae bacterium]|nr:Dabb family protein [Paracoccaceae bacterium]
MLRHIVMLTFKPDATDDEKATLCATVEAFGRDVAEVRTLTCGFNVGSGPNHHDFAVVADFDDMDAFRRYIDSPAHKAYVAGPARIVAKLSAIQHPW